MGYKLELDLPNVGQGVEVYLEGLGLFVNPGEYEVTDEEAAAFRVAHQKVTYNTDPENGLITSTDVEQGPTVLEYFNDREGITVSTDKKTPKKKVESPPNSGPSGPVDPAGNTDPGDGSNKNEGGS